ncbi:hypothetical protein CF326_g154 [Tilletia indica]|uniref:Uncharacterized protein n=1 Tax=Tilletia indica TaxID=43049 RepID=A0A177TXD4_9BASI|nr:hypothetical protein CF326_g154 [Tilletia indica]KAE8246665.1 hypothetical protein A4X13_0g5686 [Tilletia indica]
MRSHLLLSIFMLATSVVAETSRVAHNHVQQKDSLPGRATTTHAAINERTVADLAIAAGGALTSLGFFAVTGQYYLKTYGKRSDGQKGGMLTKGPSQPPSEMETTKRADPYPVILGGICVILSGGGLAANSLAHVKLLNTFGSPKKQTRRDFINLQERGKLDAVNPNTLGKGLELLAASVAMLSIPLTFANIMAIGQKPNSPAKDSSPKH